MGILDSADVMGGFTSQILRDRAMVLRYCVHFTGDPDAAEDIAQEVLLVAWLNSHKLQGRDARGGWLAGISRNVCLHWARDCKRDLKRFRQMSYAEGDGATFLVDDFDLELTYQDQEVRDLLARALERLPRETREALIHHYLLGTPQSHIARDLRITTDALEARLRRGRRLLRKVLTTDLGDEAASMDLVPAYAVGWTETRIWCAECGRGALMFRLTPDAITFRCSQCGPEKESIHTELPLRNPHFFKLVGGLRQPRRILDATLQWSHQYFVGLPGSTERKCTNCGDRVLLRRYGPDPASMVDRVTSRTGQGLCVQCERCNQASNASLGAMFDALPEVRDFQRKHARTRARPVHTADKGGRLSLVGGYETLEGERGIDVVVDAATFAPLSIQTTAGR